MNSQPGQFFAEALARFEAATAGVGLVERRFRIVDRTVRLRFAGRALEERLTPALEHLATLEEAAPDLTVCLFDTATTGVALRAAWMTGWHNRRISSTLSSSGRMLGSKLR
ncbi:MAG: hypothetical protein ABSD56_10490 [Bryobacteraceae bacterium]